MITTMYPCGYNVPSNGTIDGYTGINNSTCTFCDEMCEAPDINLSIDFFDGFDSKTVGITYGVLGLFTMGW